MEKVIDSGLCHSQTLFDDIAVDDVILATYEKAVLSTMAHVLLSPLCALCFVMAAVWSVTFYSNFRLEEEVW